jgi:hypothetical protein
MTPRKLLLPTMMLVLQATAFAAEVVEVTPTRIMVVSYWGYVAFLPAMIVALAVHCWLIRPKR